ncbi:MAG: hypothetical protein KBD85_04990, partial [Elusimicrobia bacterium]|nr:hypothetical protein [Elusimicrobiota bacterium]
MNTRVRKKSLAFCVNQGVAVVTAGAFLFSSLGANAAEATFWEERANASSRLLKRGPAEPTLLAQLSLAQPTVFNETGRVLRPIAPSLLSLSTSSSPHWARAVVSPFADVRAVYEGPSGGELRVLLVMDAHGIYSAQKNVARLLDQVGAQGKMVVGVEGTSGAFDLERHRNLLPGAGQAQLVDHLLKKGFLNGPESYGLTTEKMPDFWGVEDAALYDANVQAYRDTLAIEVESQAALQTLKKETSQRQTRLFSTPLQNLDREVQARHEDRGDLAKYVKVVWDEAGASGQGSQVRRFMEAKSK